MKNPKKFPLLAFLELHLILLAATFYQLFVFKFSCPFLEVLGWNVHRKGFFRDFMLELS